MIQLQRWRLIKQLQELHQQGQQRDVEDAREIIQGRNQRRARRYWVKPWLTRRLDYGHYDRLMRELQNEDVASFRNFVRMDPDMFHEVLLRVAPRIERHDTWYRKSITSGNRLAITLRYLATGESYRSLMYGFCVAHNTISIIIRRCCEAIFQE